ncbi:MAG TPA: outer membrane beta-barrel protein [Gemmatimonadaceae bacterium]|nr:outer membrane beta-barrel protein [Gemmatimonadaceae bacterium]
MKPRLRLLVVLLGFLAPHSASGQKTYALGVGGGPAIPVGQHLSDTQKTGYNAAVMLAIGVADLPLGIRLDGMLNQFPRRDVLTPQSGAGAYSFRVMGALANLVYAFPGTSAKPYLVAGAGLYTTKSMFEGAKAERDWGFNAGVGATFGLGPFATFIESRYHSISRSAEKGGVIQFVPVTVGLLF